MHTMRLKCATRLFLFLAPLAFILPVAAVAQDDPNEIPLGDVARNLRRNPSPPASLPVIDDDNLPRVMESADHGRPFRASWPFLLVPDLKAYEPDVTCSLSFTVNVKSLISRQYDQMELPPAQLAKIDAKAVVEGDTLTVPVFNGTDWHLSELSVAFTVARKANAGFGISGSGGDAFEQVRPEKRPDRTVIYRMRAAGAPWDRTVFSAPLDFDISPDEEWHWAIVQVKGYPPAPFQGPDARTAAQAGAVGDAHNADQNTR